MKYKLSDICSVITDYVANGSFKTLKDNVTYNNKRDYARLIRFVDYSRNFSEEGAVYVSEHSYNFLKKTKLFGGELILANVGTIGEPFLCPFLSTPMTLGPNVVMLRTNDDICDQKYLYYYFMSRNGKHLLDSITSSSAVPKFNKTDLRNQKIDLPDLEIQKKIVHILSALDQKIELNNHLSTSLAEATQAILERFMKQYPYELQPLSSIANTIDCLHSKKPDSIPDSKYQLIQLDNIRDDGFLDMSSCRYYISPEDYKNWTKRCEITEGDCVITNVGRIGAISRAPRGTKAAMGRNMTCVRLKDKQALDSYFITVLLSKHMRRQIQKNTDEGTIMNALNVSNIPKLLFPVFSESNMKKIERLLSPIRKQIECRSLENQTIVQMRASILPKLMSGEINLNKVTLNE